MHFAVLVLAGIVAKTGAIAAGTFLKSVAKAAQLSTHSYLTCSKALSLLLSPCNNVIRALVSCIMPFHLPLLVIPSPTKLALTPLSCFQI
jgi:hypothetical protein